MKQLLLVFLGGGLGSALRFIIGKLYNTQQFPLGTFLVNCIGCLLIGLIIGYGLKQNSFLKEHHMLILATGFCGGFTTFSSFAYENINLLKTGDYSNFLLYTLGSLILGFLLVFAGLHISKEFI
jgi:CrcB protein